MSDEIEMMDDDIDDDMEREAMKMVLENLGGSVKSMRRKRLGKPLIKVVKVGGSESGMEPDAPSELTEEELAKLEELC